MQQFVVPQFIEVEDKIFGPITTRQFLILLVAGTMVFLSYRFGDLALFIFTTVFIGGFCLILAFVKVNGQNFHYFLLNIIQSLRKPSLRIWQKNYSKQELNYLRKQGMEVAVAPIQKAVAVKKERIRDLALQVNTGGFYNPED